MRGILAGSENHGRELDRSEKEKDDPFVKGEMDIKKSAPLGGVKRPICVQGKDQ